MAALHRTTIYLEPKLHRALRLKAAETGDNLSRLVNTAVRCALAEDRSDLKAVDRRAREKARPFEDFLAELERNGAL